MHRPIAGGDGPVEPDVEVLERVEYAGLSDRTAGRRRRKGRLLRRRRHNRRLRRWFDWLRLRLRRRGGGPFSGPLVLGRIACRLRGGREGLSFGVKGQDLFRAMLGIESYPRQDARLTAVAQFQTIAFTFCTVDIDHQAAAQHAILTQRQRHATQACHPVAGERREVLGRRRRRRRLFGLSLIGYPRLLADLVQEELPVGAAALS
ncbi:MAG: hypothetical protein ACREEO_10865, partial [Phenylobacterium sp.]